MLVYAKYKVELFDLGFRHQAQFAAFEADLKSAIEGVRSKHGRRVDPITSPVWIARQETSGSLETPEPTYA